MTTTTDPTLMNREQLALLSRYDRICGAHRAARGANAECQSQLQELEDLILERYPKTFVRGLNDLDATDADFETTLWERLVPSIETHVNRNRTKLEPQND